MLSDTVNVPDEVVLLECRASYRYPLLENHRPLGTATPKMSDSEAQSGSRETVL